MQDRHRRVGRLSGALVVGLVVALAIPLSAGAAYPPGPFPGPAPGGAFSTVVASQTVCAAEGTIEASSGSASLTLEVPAGAFSECTQVTIYGVNEGVISPLLPAGETLIDGFAVGWTPASTASLALTLTIEDPAIAADATVFETTTSGLAKLTSVQVRAGSVEVTFTTPPGFVVSQGGVAPATASAAPNTATAPPGSAGGSDTGWLLPLGLLLALALGVAVAAGLVYRRSHSRA